MKTRSPVTRQPLRFQRPDRRHPGRHAAPRSASAMVAGSLLVAACLAVTGCTSLGGTSLGQWWHNGLKVGPNYQRPAAAVADQWIEHDDSRVVSQSADYSQWWAVFNDPVLNGLVARAYQQNLPLRVAGLRVLEARAQLGIARGDLFPQAQQAFGDYSRIQISKNTNPTNKFSAGTPLRAFDLWDLGFNATWELDVWGRFRRGIEAADANLNASIEDYDAVLVTLIGDIATTYVRIRTFEDRLHLARQNVEIQKGSLNLADVRFRNGAVTELDVQQAKANLGQTESLIPAFEADLQQAQNQLCILLGIPPRDLTELLGSDPTIPTAPAEVAVGIPAELLRRRPDIRRAEREVAAQSALIGVAVADLYPAFNISGTIQVQAEDIKNLIEGASTSGVLSPNFRWNILNYGRIQNNIRVQDARFQQLVTQYEDAVLRANQEVEDGLVGFLRAQQQVKTLQQAVDAATRSVEIARTQYRDGAIDFNQVFTLEALLVQNQDNLAVAEAQVAANLIGIYRALGGGWQIRCQEPYVAAAQAQDPFRDDETVPTPPEENDEDEVDKKSVPEGAIPEVEDVPPMPLPGEIQIPPMPLPNPADAAAPANDVGQPLVPYRRLVAPVAPVAYDEPSASPGRAVSPFAPAYNPLRSSPPKRLPPPTR